MTNVEIGLIAACLSLFALLTLLITAMNAPEGWEDENGFHLGREPDEHADPDNLGI